MSTRQEKFSGTTEVAERHRFDTEALERHLAEHVEGFTGPLTVRAFKGGQSNPTYQLETPQSPLRPAPQAAGKAAAFGARGRSRAPRHDGGPRDRLSGAARPGCCAPTTA